MYTLGACVARLACTRLGCPCSRLPRAHLSVHDVSTSSFGPLYVVTSRLLVRVIAPRTAQSSVHMPRSIQRLCCPSALGLAIRSAKNIATVNQASPASSGSRYRCCLRHSTNCACATGDYSWASRSERPCLSPLGDAYACANVRLTVSSLTGQQNGRQHPSLQHQSKLFT
jgi:hypothetical protein